ncbi:MAG: family 10 glycosylhydrolase [Chthoniobacterales bacterium]
MIRMRSLLVALLAFMAAGHTVLAQSPMRAAWVATVYNLDFPSAPGLSVEQQKAQIARIVQTAHACGLNALMVQVRPECDAFYQSSLEPWSRFLTGHQGQSPGYDPLATFIEEGRRNGIAIHAWLNPYRAATSGGGGRAQSHITHRFPQFTHVWGSLLVLDPSSTEVQDHIVSVVKEILRKYPVAGIHFDDYFYPYPSEHGHLVFNDSAFYSAYKSRGGLLSLGEWRRDNVNSLIHKVHDAVHRTRPGAIFGVSPFGIYTKGQPAEVHAGLDQYNELYADPVRWLHEGWVDYLAPQLYWQDAGPQSFSALLRWWRSPAVDPRNIPIYPGISIERLVSSGWSATEIANQLRINRTIGPGSRGGFILWSVKPLLTNAKGIRNVISSAR